MTASRGRAEELTFLDASIARCGTCREHAASQRREQTIACCGRTAAPSRRRRSSARYSRVEVTSDAVPSRTRPGLRPERPTARRGHTLDMPARSPPEPASGAPCGGVRRRVGMRSLFDSKKVENGCSALDEVIERTRECRPLHAGLVNAIEGLRMATNEADVADGGDAQPHLEIATVRERRTVSADLLLNRGSDEGLGRGNHVAGVAASPLDPCCDRPNGLVESPVCGTVGKSSATSKYGAGP